MTTPARYDLEIYQGDDFRLPLQITVNGVAKDSTGSAFTAQLRTATGGLIAAQFAVELVTPLESLIEVKLPRATTAALIPGTRYVWDFQETNASNEVTTWLHGNAIVIGEVTQ